MKTLLVIAAFSIGSAWISAETLPPANLRAPWSELKSLGFTDWSIKAFKGWDTPFDGGSKVFSFVSLGGEQFEVMAANPAYWTEEDKESQKQPFYVIHKNRFYRLKAGSDEEAKLIAMIESARPKLTGAGNTDPKILDSLATRIRTRKPMFKSKG